MDLSELGSVNLSGDLSKIKLFVLNENLSATLPDGERAFALTLQDLADKIAPATPQLANVALSANAVSPTQINLSWVSVTGATLYTIKRSTSSNMSGAVTLGTTTSTSYNSTGLTGSTTYYYQVIPSGSGYLDGGSNIASATTQASNVNPTVTLALSSSSVIAGNSVTLTATPSDSDGIIVKVEFYASGSKIGEATSAPWQISYQPGNAGTIPIYAKAIDNANGSGNSSTQNLTVNPSFNTTVLNGETSNDGVGLITADGTGNFKYNSPLPAGDDFPARMDIYLGGEQVALVDFTARAINAQGVGQPCSFTYGGQTYYIAFTNGNLNL